MNYRAILIATVQTLGLFVAGIIHPPIGQMLALFTPVPLILVYYPEREGGRTDDARRVKRHHGRPRWVAGSGHSYS